MPCSDGLLLDTHALLWWQAESDRLSGEARTAIVSAHRVLVSPITCWEVAMLVGRQRVALDRPTAAWVRDVLADDRIELAELSPAVAVAAAELPEFHGDPADRFLYATARLHHVPLVTKDELLQRYAAQDRAVTVVW